jgi:D-alanyl-D-alanine carboxypeptidase/D-alanyl-D-alanine-endopeptidase (penicillin-binding protein 4)
MMPLPLYARSALAPLALLFCFAVPPVGADPIQRALALGDASLVVEEGGRLVIADDADRGMVPASTMKLLTALAAIERWGLGHRFSTVRPGPRWPTLGHRRR